MHPKLYQVCIYFRDMFLRAVPFESQEKLKAYLRNEGVSFSNDSICNLEATDDPLIFHKGGMLYEVAIPLGCLGDVYVENKQIYKALSLYAREHEMPYRKVYYMCRHNHLPYITREGRIYIPEEKNE